MPSKFNESPPVLEPSLETVWCATESIGARIPGENRRLVKAAGIEPASALTTNGDGARLPLNLAVKPLPSPDSESPGVPCSPLEPPHSCRHLGDSADSGLPVSLRAPEERLEEEHLERYVWENEERYEPRKGSLRKIVPTAVASHLACGRLEGGFARIRCPNCRAEHLFGLLARAARDAIVRAILDRNDVAPGLVVSIQTFGSYAANFHPHVHALVTDGALTEEGEFLRLPYFDARLVEEVFRRRVLQRLHRGDQDASRILHRHMVGMTEHAADRRAQCLVVQLLDDVGHVRDFRGLTRGWVPGRIDIRAIFRRLIVRDPHGTLGLRRRQEQFRPNI